MKNTMKKLLSLVLVAMLLVCAVPFQAAAAEADAKTVKVNVYVDDVLTADKTITVKPGESITLNEELAKSLVKSDKAFVKWTGASGNEANGQVIPYEKIPADYSVNLYVKKIVEDTRVDAKVPVKI